MNRLVSISLWVLVCVTFGLGANGDLDLTFGGGTGSRILDMAGQDLGRRIFVQPDGKLVVVGSSNGQYTALRYLTDGTPDVTFSGDGIASALVTSACFAAVLQPDGKILIGGSSAVGTALIMRLNSDGTPDGTFDGDGIATIAVGGSGIPTAWGLMLQSDGKIVVAGRRQLGVAPIRDVFLARLNTNGSLDGTYGAGGVTTLSHVAGATEDVLKAVIQPDDRVVLVGAVNNPTKGGFQDPIISRFLPTGAPDLTFDGDGYRIYDTPVFQNHQALAIARTPAGKLLVSTSTSEVLRLNADGTSDTSFDGDGAVTIAGAINFLFLGKDGRFYGNNQGVSKYNANGTPDTTFSGDGNAPLGANVITAIDQQTDGKIVITGTNDALNTAFYTARLLDTLNFTAAEISVSGRVLANDGRGLTNALVTLWGMHGESWSVVTGRRGTFSFDAVPAGETYTVSVASRRFAFEPMIVQPVDSITDLTLMPGGQTAPRQMIRGSAARAAARGR